MRAISMVAMALLAPSLALAQVSPQQTKELVIDGDELVVGGLPAPEISVVEERQRPRQSSLLKERESFAREAIESVSAL